VFSTSISGVYGNTKSQKTHRSYFTSSVSSASNFKVNLSFLTVIASQLRVRISGKLQRSFLCYSNAPCCILDSSLPSNPRYRFSSLKQKLLLEPEDETAVPCSRRERASDCTKDPMWENDSVSVSGHQPTWVGSTSRRRQNPVSETSCFK
jgi:hypothetical protein